MNNPGFGLTFRVGLLIFTSIAFLIFLYVFFKGQLRNSNTYQLTLLVNDAQGIAKQDQVYLAGVSVGQVSAIGLANGSRQAIIQLVILNKYKIPVGSTFLITSSLLSGEASVNIIPPSPKAEALTPNQYIRPNTVINGQDGLGATSIASEAGAILQQFNKTATTADKLLDQLSNTVKAVNNVVANPQTQSSLLGTVKNLNAASEQGVLLTKDLRAAVAEDNLQIASTLRNVDQASATVNNVASGNRSQLNNIVANLNKATAQIAQLSQNANDQLNKGGAIQNLADTSENLKEATVKLNTIENDIEGVTGDKQVQADLKNTLHNASEASDDTRVLVKRLNALTGSHPTIFAKGDLKFVSRLDFTENMRTNHFRTDFNVYAPFSNSNFARLGVYDLTGTNRFNFQFGQTDPANKLLTYRVGVYNGQVGVGADYDLFGDHDFSIDVYNPNRLTTDFRQRIPLRSQSSLYIGLDDFPRTNAITLGFELQR